MKIRRYYGSYKDTSLTYYHHRLNVYTTGVDRYIIKLVLWAYLLFYGLGRITYIRVLPNIISDRDFASEKTEYHGCVRFTATSKIGKWAFPMNLTDEPLGFGLAGKKR
jgi:hypothetical protein